MRTTARRRCTSRCSIPTRRRRPRPPRTSRNTAKRANGGVPMLTFTPSPDRFVVEEIPAYTPSGEGTHTFLWLEKHGLTTFDAINLIARAFGVAARDVGYAGMKDKQATTRQWLSVPGLEPERALAFADGGAR